MMRERKRHQPWRKSRARESGLALLADSNNRRERMEFGWSELFSEATESGDSNVIAVAAHDVAAAAGALRAGKRGHWD